MIFKVFKVFFCKFHLNIVPSEAQSEKINNANFVFSFSKLEGKYPTFKTAGGENFGKFA